jgi:hypothetical protein
VAIRRLGKRCIARASREIAGAARSSSSRPTLRCPLQRSKRSFECPLQRTHYAIARGSTTRSRRWHVQCVRRSRLTPLARCERANLEGRHDFYS